jgi:hypothetical protein
MLFRSFQLEIPLKKLGIALDPTTQKQIKKNSSTGRGIRKINKNRPVGYSAGFISYQERR